MLILKNTISYLNETIPLIMHTFESHSNVTTINTKRAIVKSTINELLKYNCGDTSHSHEITKELFVDGRID